MTFIFDKGYMQTVIEKALKRKKMKKKDLFRAIPLSKAETVNSQIFMVRRKLDPKNQNLDIIFYKNVCKLLDIPEEDLFKIKK